MTGPKRLKTGLFTILIFLISISPKRYGKFQRIYFEVSIKIRESFPEVALYKESIKFLAKIDADIGFGFY